jgi:hypothetical protein
VKEPKNFGLSIIIKIEENSCPIILVTDKKETCMGEREPVEEHI